MKHGHRTPCNSVLPKPSLTLKSQHKVEHLGHAELPSTPPPPKPHTRPWKICQMLPALQQQSEAANQLAVPSNGSVKSKERTQKPSKPGGQGHSCVPMAGDRQEAHLRSMLLSLAWSCSPWGQSRGHSVVSAPHPTQCSLSMVLQQSCQALWEPPLQQTLLKGQQLSAPTAPGMGAKEPRNI